MDGLISHTFLAQQMVLQPFLLAMLAVDQSQHPNSRLNYPSTPSHTQPVEPEFALIQSRGSQLRSLQFEFELLLVVGWLMCHKYLRNIFVP